MQRASVPLALAVAGHSQVRITWTNADGDWLKLFIAGPAFITEELSGDILTVTARLTGEVDKVVLEGQEIPLDLEMGGDRDPAQLFAGASRRP